MTAPREMSITYAGQAIPGAIAGATLHLHGIHRLYKGFETGECVFQIVVEASDPAVLAAASLALEAHFQIKYGILDVQLLGNQSFSFDETLLNAFNVTPLITKPGFESPRFDSNRSRLYEVAISADLPAFVDPGAPTDEGIREFAYDVALTSARRGSIVIRGTGTATPGPPSALASENVDSLIPPRVATIALALGWTVEIVSQLTAPNEGDTLATFEFAYRQIIFDQEPATLNSTFLVDPVMAIRVGVRGTETDPLASPLRAVACDYTAAVDFEQGRDIVDVFNNVVLPYVIAKMAGTVGGTMALMVVEPGYNFDENTISARFEGVSASSGTLLSRSVEYQDDLDTGLVIRYIWPLADEGTNEPSAAYVYQANKTIRRTVTTTTENVGEPAPAPGEARGGGFFAIGGGGVGGQGGGGFFALQGRNGDQLEVAPPIEGSPLLRTRSTKTSKRFVGLRGGQLKIRKRETIEVFEIVRLITSV